MKVSEILRENAQLPTHFGDADEFYWFIHKGMGLKDPYCEHQGGGAWVAYDDDKLIGTFDEHTGQANFEVGEQHEGKSWNLNPKKKGMFKGKSSDDIRRQLSKVKASGHHKEGSAELTRERELNFALQAKRHWGH